LRTEPRVVRGQQVFAMRCAKCHPGGREGLGTQLSPIPEVLFRIQVRTGLGEMPSFPSKTLSDDDLDDLVAYYKAIRFRRMDER
jgi:mono/diheme cytochrome c family protein